MRKSLIATALFLLFSLPVLAAQKTVALSVPGMTCSACPITFDDAKTSVEELTQATTNAGYPSTLKQSRATQE